jgi:hypothetical protein
MSPRLSSLPREVLRSATAKQLCMIFTRLAILANENPSQKHCVCYAARRATADVSHPSDYLAVSPVDQSTFCTDSIHSALSRICYGHDRYKPSICIGSVDAITCQKVPSAGPLYSNYITNENIINPSKWTGKPPLVTTREFSTEHV